MYPLGLSLDKYGLFWLQYCSESVSFWSKIFIRFLRKCLQYDPFLLMSLTSWQYIFQNFQKIYFLKNLRAYFYECYWNVEVNSNVRWCYTSPEIWKLMDNSRTCMLCENNFCFFINFTTSFARDPWWNNRVRIIYSKLCNTITFET